MDRAAHGPSTVAADGATVVGASDAIATSSVDDEDDAVPSSIAPHVQLLLAAGRPSDAQLVLLAAGRWGAAHALLPARTPAPSKRPDKRARRELQRFHRGE